MAEYCDTRFAETRRSVHPVSQCNALTERLIYEGSVSVTWRNPELETRRYALKIA